MGWFKAKERAEEWLAVALYEDRVDVAQVQRNGAARPVVRICESYTRKGSELDALKSVARELRSSRFRIATMLSPSEYQMQQVEAPAVPESELKQAVRWKLKDLLDYNVDIASVDVVHVPSDRSGSGRGQYVYAVSAKNESILARMNLFLDAKLPLEAIDVPEMAQRNIATLFEEPARGIAVLAFDERGGLLTISAGGELYMARQTDISATQLTDPQRSGHDQLLDRLVLELQRSLDHFDRQFGYVTLSRMLIAPLPADVGLERHLSQNLDVPVRTLDLTEVLDLDGAPQLNDPTRQSYRLHILGAALRDSGATA